MDVINEPRHRNCENCFFQWMNFHPTLVETVDEAWREHGKEFIIRLRGKWFAKMFGRYMMTVAHLKEQEQCQQKKNGQTEDSVALQSSSTSAEVVKNLQPVLSNVIAVEQN